MKKNKDIPVILEADGMAAMSDVVFLLLIFFIVTMSNYVQITLLDIKIPTSSSTSENTADLEKILKVEIAENGEYLVNGVPMDRLALLTTLKRYARLMPDAEFLVRCHPESKHKDLVTFLADASLLELKNIKLVK